MFTSTRAPARVLSSTLMAFVGVGFLWGLLDSGAKCFGQESMLVGTARAQAAEQQIRATLRKPVSWNFREKPLSEFASELGRSLAINVRLDVSSLRDAVIDANTLLMTLRVQDVSAEAALSSLLRPLSLDWFVVDEMLVIATSDAAQSRVVTRVYLVRDLVTTTANGDDYDSLIDMITSTVAAPSWTETGGPGSLVGSSSSQTLVVSQSRDVHDQIEQLLAALRKARGLQGIQPTAAASAGTVDLPASVSPPPTRVYSAPRAWNKSRLHR